MKVNIDNYPNILTDEQSKRFLSKIDKTDYCWNWKAYLNKDGYGTFSLNKRTVLAHRLYYVVYFDSVSPSLELDHTCRNRSCVNPDHLDPVTSQVNLLRGNTHSYNNSVKTHCLRKHLLEEPNLRKDQLRRGRRQCLACSRTQSKYTNEKKKGVFLDANLFQEISDQYYNEMRMNHV